MGASSSCTCSEESKYRFKGFVVSVYPEDIHGGPDEEALGKLNNYVASNSERIPRVCRKISKLLTVHLEHRRQDRVMVSIRMMRSLIEHAERVDGFVPHTIAMCSQLLATSGVDLYKVGAADLLCILCSRLDEDPRYESSRRLISDHKQELLEPLRGMAERDLASHANVMATQVRYAALLAIGHIATCLDSALAGDVNKLIVPILTNLISHLRLAAKRPVSDSDIKALTTVDAQPPTTSVQLPPKDYFLAYTLGCRFAIGAVAGCVTTASVGSFLSLIVDLMHAQKAWATPFAPTIILQAIVCYMERRPQRLGFAVYQCLCEVGVVNKDASVRVGILRGLAVCVVEVPMTGGRPQLALKYLLSVARLPVQGYGGASSTAAATTEDEGEDGDISLDDVSAARTTCHMSSAAISSNVAQATQDACVDVVRGLYISTYRQRNAPQMQSLLIALLKSLREAGQEAIAIGEGAATSKKSNWRTMLMLRFMAVASPYMRTVPPSDRSALDIVSVLQPFIDPKDGALYGDDLHRTLAIRVLRGALAGVPDYGSSTSTTSTEIPLQQPQPLSSVLDISMVSHSSLSIPLLSLGTSDVIETDVRDIEAAKQWVNSMMLDTTTISPRCVVEVANVVAAIMAGSRGISSLPFVLHYLYTLQQHCAGESVAAAAAEKVASMEVSTTPTSPLTRAWLHMSIAVLARLGKTYDCPELTEYCVKQILSARVAAGETASCFSSELILEDTAADATPNTRRRWRSERFTVCGLSTVPGDAKRHPLTSEPATLQGITTLPSFVHIAHLLAVSLEGRGGDISTVLACDSQDVVALTAAIEHACVWSDEPEADRVPAAAATVEPPEKDNCSSPLGTKNATAKAAAEFAAPSPPSVGSTTSRQSSMYAATEADDNNVAALIAGPSTVIFSLDVPQERTAKLNTVSITLHDDTAQDGVGEELKFSSSANTVAKRVAEVLAHCGVNQSTSLVGPGTSVGPLPALRGASQDPPSSPSATPGQGAAQLALNGKGSTRHHDANIRISLDDVLDGEDDDDEEVNTLESPVHSPCIMSSLSPHNGGALLQQGVLTMLVPRGGKTAASDISRSGKRPPLQAKLPSSRYVELI